MLKFEVETLEGVDEAHKPLYVVHGDKFRLAVEGLDPADQLKEALRKEREEKAAAKSKLSEFEAAAAEAEQKRQQERGEFKALWEKEQEQRTLTAKELTDLKDKIATGERQQVAHKMAMTLTRDASRAELLKKEALAYVVYTPDGIKINGPAGDAWTEKQLAEHLASVYPFLVDGNQASGGGAAGGTAVISNADILKLPPIERITAHRAGTKK